MKKQKTSHHKALIESIAYVVLSFLVTFLFIELGLFHGAITALGGFGYIGAFIAGMFFVSVFTAAPAAVLLISLSGNVPVVPLIIVAGLGTVVGDSIILHLLREGFDRSISLFPKETGIKRVIGLLRHSKYRFFLTIIGALVVASPLPDELGLALMGISRMKPIPAMILTFVLNSIGIGLLLFAFR